MTKFIYEPKPDKGLLETIVEIIRTIKGKNSGPIIMK